MSSNTVNTSGEDARQNPHREKFLNLTNLLLVALVLCLVGVAWWAMVPRGVEAPLPHSEYAVNADDVSPTGSDGTRPVEIKNADTDVTPGDAGGDGWSTTEEAKGGSTTSKGVTMKISLSQMAPMSLFIPEDHIYSPVVPTHQFRTSRYANFDTILAPTNPRRSAWFDEGAPLVGGSEGTTFIAGHIAYNYQWGALHTLSNTMIGNIAYTKDAQGRAQKWKAVQMRVLTHTAFPQEYWKATGVRQLVVTRLPMAITTPMSSPSSLL